MITVQVLEDSDHIHPEDWCRPLNIVSMGGGRSDYYSFKSEYTSTPENNAKWVKVKYILGKPWHGKTVREYTHAMKKFNYVYEFVRGEIPNKHRLNLKDYNVTDYTKVKNESPNSRTCY